MRHEIGTDSWTDFGTNTVDVVAVAKAYNRVVVDDVVAGDGVEEWGSSLLRISVNLLVDVVKIIFCVTSLVKALLDTDYDVKATFLLYVENGNQKRIT